MNSCLYRGEVMHLRLQPHRHQFRYPFTSWYLDLDELAQLDRTLTGFSYNRFGPFRFNDRDFGPGRSAPLKHYISEQLVEAGMPCPSRVMLLCQPRCLGFMFNSLSAYFCYDDQNRLLATLYEVSNTMSERHLYLVGADQQRPLKQYADKAMYVSPFFEMACRYRFKVQPPEQRFSVQISLDHAQATLFHAHWSGQRQALTSRALLQLLWQPPLTLQTFTRIHWQALKLWLKRTPLVKYTPSPAFQVSRGGLGWQED
jgi:DUF1365 family protein